MGKMEKNRKENHSTKVTKIPKTKEKIWDEYKRSGVEMSCDTKG
jgi:hypothetical protein